MNANEMIYCELREDGLHVMAYRHNGETCASTFMLEGVGDVGIFEIDGGRRTFADEHELRAFANETIFPCFKHKFKQLREHPEDVRIITSICEMSIGRECPKLYSWVVAFCTTFFSLGGMATSAMVNGVTLTCV